MNIRIAISILTVLSINFCSFLGGQTEPLTKNDISKVMQQIFTQHVDKKEMTTPILNAAFKKYIEQFDPNGIYLLEEEIRPYIQISDAEMAQVLLQYKKNDFTAFSKLNANIQKAIERARLIRKELSNPPYNADLFKAQKEEDQPDSFAKSEAQLKSRIKENMAQFIQKEKKRYGEKKVMENKKHTLAIYEGNMRHFENNYLDVSESGVALSESARENLFVMHVLKALASSLDSHTKFLDNREAFEMKVRLQKEFEGVGLNLENRPEGILVKGMAPSSPAEKSGQIKIGDRLVAIDNKLVDNIAFETVLEMMQGKAGTKVNLTFSRDDDNGVEENLVQVQLKRDEIPVVDGRVQVSSEAFGNGIIGKITLHSFYQGDNGISSEQDIRQAINKLNEQGNLRGLILDLRDNTGGFLTQAVKVVGLFITSGVVVISKYFNGEEHFYRDMDGRIAYDGPLVVLTSKETASAAEIVAQALQDYGVAIVVGDEHTYGKGTIQSQTVTENQGGSFFKVTVGKYYTVSGKTPQMLGVKADILVPTQFFNEEIGEEYLEYPVPADRIPSSFQDTLDDINPNLKGWYLRYYTPKQQQKKLVWKQVLPELRKNSEYRIAKNSQYQAFLKKLRSGIGRDLSDDQKSILTNKEPDLQMAEATNIVKDMILLQSHLHYTATDP